MANGKVFLGIGKKMGATPKDKLGTARDIREGAERLRKLAADEADAERAAEMLQIAKEMDEHAAELERSTTNRRPTANGAVA